MRLGTYPGWWTANRSLKESTLKEYLMHSLMCTLIATYVVRHDFTGKHDVPFNVIVTFPPYLLYHEDVWDL
jgi:hypothetical protein